MIILFFLWLFLSILVAFLASSFNKNGFLWFCLSFITSPFLCFILILFLEKKNIVIEKIKNKFDSKEKINNYF